MVDIGRLKVQKVLLSCRNFVTDTIRAVRLGLTTKLQEFKKKTRIRLWELFYSYMTFNADLILFYAIELVFVYCFPQFVFLELL